MDVFPNNKALCDPIKVGRVLYVLFPFLPQDFSPRFISPTAKKLYEEANEYFQKKRVVSGLEKIRNANIYLKSRLEELKSKQIFFTTGISITIGEDRRHDSSFFSYNFRLSTEILKILNKLDEELGQPTKLEELVFYPVSPFPAFIAEVRRNDEGKLYFAHPFPEIFEEEMSLEKDIFSEDREQILLYRFKEGLFVSYPWEEQDELRKAGRYLNKKIMAVAWKKILDVVGESEPKVYAKSSGYVGEILKMAKLKFKGEVMRNASYPLLGECEPSALRVLAGWIKWLVYSS